MKKLLSLFLLLALLAGCKKKEDVYKENLNGTWQVYKYLLNNVEQTAQFQNTYTNYTITFATQGTFSEQYSNSVSDTFVNTGTFKFTDNDQKIVLDDSTYTQINDSTIIGKLRERTYTMFNLTSDHVQLRNDTSQLYMNKVP